MGHNWSTGRPFAFVTHSMGKCSLLGVHCVTVEFITENDIIWYDYYHHYSYGIKTLAKQRCSVRTTYLVPPLFNGMSLGTISINSDDQSAFGHLLSQKYEATRRPTSVCGEPLATATRQLISNFHENWAVSATMNIHIQFINANFKMHLRCQ